MKKVYIQRLIAVGMLFFGFVGFAQQNLLDSEYGTLINNYLIQNQATYRTSGSDTQDLYVTDEYFSESTKINHVYVTQRYQGIEIFNAVSSVAVKDNAVFYYADNFVTGISHKANAFAPQINAQSAIENAVSQLNLGSIDGLKLISSQGNEYLFNGANVSQSDINVKLVYFYVEKQDELKLAWDLNIYTLSGENYWSVRVDAHSGQIIDIADWVLSCNFGDGAHSNHSVHANTKEEAAFTLFKDSPLVADGSRYNVFEFPVEAPNWGGRSVVTSPADNVASPFGWHDTNGSPGAEYTTTRGNNVNAYEDKAGNNRVGRAPSGGQSLNFDFPLNLNQDPSQYTDVATVNLFYANNVMHDVYYHYGFTERAGNFQTSNYGKGGRGGDHVLAEAQDGSGTNNANFLTPPDGQSPRMQMYIWDAKGGTPLIINNGPLARGYYTSIANDDWVKPLSKTPVTADLVVVVDDNTGGDTSSDPNDGCNNITNGAALNGKIVVIRRGVCSFEIKVKAVADLGAKGVIIVNNAPGSPIGMSGSGAVKVNIPVVMVSDVDGEAIIASLLAGNSINASLVLPDIYKIDGSLDNGIIAHEYGHGISTRLTGGPMNSGCLNSESAPEQMGEGWSDWFALMLTMKPGDLSTKYRGIGTYAMGQPVTGSGIRPAPYNTDFAVNPYTYKNTNDQAISVPHGIGFIWASVLWDLTWAYVDKYGFDDDVYYGTGGNNKVMQLVMDGIKLQKCSPGFVDGRDAILRADKATGGEDQCLIWEVFAKRGVGLNASQGSISSRSDQREDKNIPDFNKPEFSTCTTLLGVEEFNSSSYKVYPNPTNGQLFIKTSKNYGQVTLSLTDINGRQVLSKKVELFNQVELDINSLQSGIYILSINGKDFNANHKVIKN